ncbi:hypothetical protein DPEC_G00215050 [Dallia pectoralis]|uniref:Uncharacterized protein n=1 Tax=Dallia pectoralis TaxID=75939 RepID=A0ACC2G2D4_DALPE|nr:hypothetical protein DPEC_G00215050 [Dallia pectoralis]
MSVRSSVTGPTFHVCSHQSNQPRKDEQRIRERDQSRKPPGPSWRQQSLSETTITATMGSLAGEQSQKAVSDGR